MRHLLAVTLVIWMGAISSAPATTVATDRWTCPACGRKFNTFVNPSYSTSGADEEGRPFCLGEDIQEFRVHDCPYCHYAGFGWNFPGGTDVPAGPALQRVRDALARDAATLPAGALWPLERVKAAEICDLARNAAPRELERLYQLGAWLADDAAEDALAVQYRDKSLLQRVKWAGIEERTSAAYIQAMHAAWAARDSDAAKLLDAVEPSLKAALAIANQQYAKTRRIVLKRIQAESGNPPATQESTDSADDEGDWDAIIEKASDQEALSLWKPSTIQKMLTMLDVARGVAQWKMLGEATALKKAQDGGFDDRQAFIRAYGRTQDPVRSAAIGKLIENPFGPGTRPTTDPAESNPIPYSNSLMMLWERVDPAANPAGSIIESENVAQCLKQLGDARIAGNADAAFQAICGLAAHPSRKVAAGLLADLQAHPAEYCTYFPLDDGNYRVWHAMAMDENMSAQAAAHALHALVQKEIEAKSARAALRPLAYCRSDESLAILLTTIRSSDAEIRVEAAKCLLCRGKHEGAVAFVADAIDSPQSLAELEPAMAAALVRSVTRDDIPALSKLNAEWPGPILRKADDTKAMAAVTARAALAKADGARFLPGYEKAIDELLGSPVEGHEAARLPWEDTAPEHMQLLGWCANIYYVSYIGRQWRPMLAEGTSDYGMSEAIRTLAAANTHEMDDVLATQVRRPIPFAVKHALIETRNHFQIDGLATALERWAKSNNAQLAMAARESLEQSGGETRPAP